jgi:hypothetical protein
MYEFLILIIFIIIFIIILCNINKLYFLHRVIFKYINEVYGNIDSDSDNE